MRPNRLVVGVTVAIGFAGMTNSVAAGEQQITGSIAGSIVSIAIDTNGDGMAGFLSMARGKTNLGLTTVQAVSEVTAQLPEVKTCPKGNREFPWLMAHVVIHFDESGDLLFAQYSSGVTCFDSITMTFTGEGKGTFVGGTGKFVNAMGSFETTTTGKPLVADRAMHEFDSFSGQFTGTIVTP